MPLDAEADIGISADDGRENSYVYGALDNTQNKYVADNSSRAVTLYVDLRSSNVINTVDFKASSVDRAILTALVQGVFIEQQVFDLNFCMLISVLKLHVLLHVFFFV